MWDVYPFCLQNETSCVGSASVLPTSLTSFARLLVEVSATFLTKWKVFAVWLDIHLLIWLSAHLTSDVLLV